MTRLLALVLLIAAAGSLRGKVVDLEPKRGSVVAATNWTDEIGRARSLNEFAGYPLILLPIYTRCPGACIQNVARLKEALANSSADPRQFRVFLFSFDAGDNPASLAKYRQRENIPLAWSIGSASQSDIDTLLDSIGMQVGRASVEFVHSNTLVFLDSKLRIAKWIYGTNYSGRDLDLALKIAEGKSDWLGRNAQLFYALLLFSGSILCVALCYYWSQFWSSRQSSGDMTAINSVISDG